MARAVFFFFFIVFSQTVYANELPPPTHSIQHSLKDKVVLVTGASGDIGLGICKKFLDDGAIVIAHYHKNREKLELLSQQNKERFFLISKDFENPETMKEFWDDALKIKGVIHIVINSVGIEEGSEDPHSYAKVATRVMNINYLSPSCVCYYAVSFFKEKNIPGIIINLGSRAAYRGLTDGFYVYSDSKAALTKYTQQIARDYAPFGILAYTIAPGPVEGQMFRNQTPKIQEKCLSSFPTKKPVTVEEIADIVMYYAKGYAPSGTGGVFDLMGASWFH